MGGWIIPDAIEKDRATGEHFAQIDGEWVPVDAVEKDSTGNYYVQVSSDQPEQGFTGRAFGERLLDSVMNLPNLAAHARPPTVFELPGMLRGEKPDLEDIPTGSGRGVFAGVQMLSEKFGENVAKSDIGGQKFLGEAPGIASVDEALANQQSISEARGKSHPFTTALEKVLADGLLIATGRLPFAKGMSKPFSGLPHVGSSGPLKVLDNALQSGPVKGLATLAGRTTEAGFEGATIAILQDGDPMETAAWAAGTQATGGALTGIFSGAWEKMPGSAGFKMSIAALGTAGYYAMAKSILPGAGYDEFDESMMSGFDKLKYVLLLGGLAGLAGMGRVKDLGRPGDWMDDIAREVPDIADALTALPRNTVFSSINELLKEDEAGNPTPGVVLDRFSQDPAYFGDSAQLLGEALMDENASFVETVNGLYDSSEEFRQKVDAIAFPAEPPKL